MTPDPVARRLLAAGEASLATRPADGEARGVGITFVNVVEFGCG